MGGGLGLPSFGIWDYVISLSLCSRTHRSVHHVGLAVPQSLDGVEDVHHTLSLGHLAHNAAGAQHSAAAASVPVTHMYSTRQSVGRGGKSERHNLLLLYFFIFSPDVLALDE